MNPPSSSTSSSEPVRASRWGPAALVGWVLAFLIVFDIGVNVLFAYPSNPKDLHPNRFALYFDYGRSMEGRLRRATRPDPEQTAPITLSGWYSPLETHARAPKPSGHRITVYGNSHSVRLADAIQKTSDEFSTRSVAAPGATANWAYGAFLRDKRAEQGDAAVLTIMPSNLPMIRSMAAMTWNTSFAMPYTADQFEVQDGQLIRHEPPYESFTGYIRALEDPVRWAEAKAQFARYDPFYNSFLFDQNFTDHSSVIRLIRRGHGQRRDAKVRGSSLNRNGYYPKDQAVLVANAIIAEFARNSRQRGLIPVIYIVNSRGYGDQMYRALANTLESQHIPYFSSHTLIDPNDPRNYLPDSHFTDANDRLIAQELERVIDRELAKPN